VGAEHLAGGLGSEASDASVSAQRTQISDLSSALWPVAVQLYDLDKVL